MLDTYDLLETIGAGSFGHVYRAKDKATGEVIAIKLIDKIKFERKERKNFHKECAIHAQLRHPNIIQMLNSFETPDYIVVMTELADIDLHRFLAKSTKKLTEQHVQRLGWNLLSALHYLHSHRILHRDLKPQNILLNNYRSLDGMVAKLCDFGLARNMASETYLLTSIKGTPLYMAPEVMSDAVYDERAEFWSLGCILYQAMFGKPPIKAKSLEELMEWKRNPKILWPDEPVSSECKSFLQGILKKEPYKRFTWPQIIEHPYVAHNLLIIDEARSDRPLTMALTSSQQIKKDKQRDAIILHRGKKMIAEAMNKCPQLKEPSTPDNGKQSKKKRHTVIGDNDSISSMDSVNAIVQTDLETDVEGPMERRIPTRQLAPSELAGPSNNQNFVIQRYTDQFQVHGNVAAKESSVPTNDMANLRICTMAENFQQESGQRSASPKIMKPIERSMHVARLTSVQQPIQADRPQINASVREHAQCSMKDAGATNKELEKRKLSQNLENFSIRLGNNETANEKYDSERTKETPPTSSQSIEIAGKTDGDSDESAAKADTDHFMSPPIENEEWLAFIRMTTQEVLRGEIDSLTDSNLLTIIVAILRNLSANIKVIESVVQLLSIPFVLELPSGAIKQIRAAYVKTNLLPNLICASKIICTVRPQSESMSSSISVNFAALLSDPHKADFAGVHELSSEQLRTLRTIYELVCQLLHRGEEEFLFQFRDSVHTIAGDLLCHFYANAAILLISAEGTRLLSVTTSILCFVLRETPENAEMVEQIIFDQTVNIIALLKNENALLRAHLCRLLRIIGRFSCYALQQAWSTEFRVTLEGLLDDDNSSVKEAARSTINELRDLPFYKANQGIK